LYYTRIVVWCVGKGEQWEQRQWGQSEQRQWEQSEQRQWEQGNRKGLPVHLGTIEGLG